MTAQNEGETVETFNTENKRPAIGERILEEILEDTQNLCRVKPHVLLAIDGRCASGKTTLAAELKSRLEGRGIGCSVVSMDHFFLQPQQRTRERLAEPGGNVDYGRFLEQVMTPLREGRPFGYRPYDCHRGCMGEPVAVEASPVTVVEGSYSCHPCLEGYYDRKIFLTVSPGEQMDRIRRRNGPVQAERFRDLWIPLEEAYFAACHVEERCGLRFRTDEKMWDIPLRTDEGGM